MLAPNTKAECVLSDKCRKVLAVVTFMVALAFVTLSPIALFALEAAAGNPSKSNPHQPPSIASPGGTASSADGGYAWLIAIATPIAVIASAWGAVRSIQASHAETLKEIKLENESTNEKVDAVAEKVEKLGREIAYMQGKFNSPASDD